MFKTKPKIKSITSCATGDFIFTFGLGKDGLVYVWNAIQACWLPHTQSASDNAPAPTKKAK